MMVLLADCSRTFEATPRALSQPDQSSLPERAPALDRLGESSLSIREFALCDWLPMQDLPKSGHTRSREAPFGEKARLLRRWAPRNVNQFAPPVPLAREARLARIKSIIWSIDGPGLLAVCAIICGWKNRIIAVQVHSAASGTSGASNSPDATPWAMMPTMLSVMICMCATQTCQLSCIAIATISCSLESPT